MSRVPREYLVNRLITLVLTVFIAATLIWIIPRLSRSTAAEIALGRMAAGAGAVGKRRLKSWPRSGHKWVSISR